jgi:ATP-dependent Clp protease ATP-binding subunit ClpC
MTFIPKLIRYPFWFFVENYGFWMRFYRRTLILLNDALGLKATVANLFKPYRQDHTAIGLFIGVVVRAGYSLGGFIFLSITFILLTIAVALYFTSPLIGFLLLIAISDYPLIVKSLGLVFLFGPLLFYIITEIIKAPSYDETGYPIEWEKEVLRRLQLTPESALAAKENGTFEQFLKERKLTMVDYEIVRQWVAHRKWEQEKWKYWQDEHYQRTIGTNLGWVSGWMRESKYFTRDLTQEVMRHKVFPWLGLDEIINRVLTVLTREQHRNALLVGASGVGKTSVVYAIARRMYEQGGFRVMDLNIAGLLAGSGAQGEFERRFNQTMYEFRQADLILVVEDVDRLVSEGVAQYFYPTLRDGDFPIIATVTHKKLREVLEKEPTFLNAFEQVTIPEPELPDVMFILQEKVSALEGRYGVLITYQALKAAVELTEKYISDRVFPSKAIDVLEEACAAMAAGRFAEPKSKGHQSKIITSSHIEHVLQELTGIAVGELAEGEGDKLIRLEQLLHERIIGQDEAVNEIANAMRRARSGLVSGERPLGSFLFLGPTGVGKSQTAKTFAEVYFGGQDKMVRMDMSEYSEFGMVERFLDRISDEVRRQPFAVVLLDEFEKADRKIHNLFLQVLEDGRATDTHGNVVDFRNTIVIATSNATNPEEAFSPELRNRFDGIVDFLSLEHGQIQDVTKLELKELAQKIFEKEIEVSFTPNLIQAVSDLGYDPQMGARPIRRAIQDYIENPLAQALIEQDIQPGDKIVLDWMQDHLVIRDATGALISESEGDQTSSSVGMVDPNQSPPSPAS